MRNRRDIEMVSCGICAFLGKTKRVFFTSRSNCGTYHNFINKIDENVEKTRSATVFKGVSDSVLGGLRQ